MMPAINRDLAVFEGMSSEQIRTIVGSFDELDALLRDRLEKVSGATLDDSALQSAERVLYSLRGAADEAGLHRAIRDSNLSNETKSALLDLGKKQGCKGGQNAPLRHDSNYKLPGLMKMMDIDESIEVPETIKGLLADYADKDEDSLTIVRSIRNAI